MSLVSKIRKINAGLNTRQRFIVIQLLLFGTAIGPLGLYRLSRGEMLHAAFDAGLTIVFVGIARMSLIDRYLELATRVMAVVYVVGVIGVINIMGQIGLFWAFAAGLGAYFAIKASEAMLVSTVMYVLIAFGNFGGADYPTVIAFSACYALVVMFGYYFSTRLWQENERLDREAHEDRLTALLNRRSFDDDLAQLVEEGCSSPEGCALLVVDIDNFKLINDNYGHAAGDRVLRNIARLLADHVPDDVRLYRFGGEEFVAIFPGSMERAAMLAETLREKIEGAELLRSDEKPITISIGITQRRPQDDSRSWFQRADSALYQAKETGRNRVAVV